MSGRNLLGFTCRSRSATDCVVAGSRATGGGDAAVAGAVSLAGFADCCLVSGLVAH